tara:strand:- start:1875 stop:3245 length:1371 start_codon:yes stop_codon:yes gene_type:complete
MKGENKMYYDNEYKCRSLSPERKKQPAAGSSDLPPYILNDKEIVTQINNKLNKAFINLGDIKDLITEEASIADRDVSGLLAFYRAAYVNGQGDIVHKLLKSGEVPEAHKEKALHLAAAEGHIEVVNVLLNHKVNVNGEIANLTAINRADVKGHDEIVELLIEHKAEPAGTEQPTTELSSEDNEGRLGYLRNFNFGNSFNPDVVGEVLTFMEKSSQMQADADAAVQKRSIAAQAPAAAKLERINSVVKLLMSRGIPFKTVMESFNDLKKLNLHPKESVQTFIPDSNNESFFVKRSSNRRLISKMYGELDPATQRTLEVDFQNSNMGFMEKYIGDKKLVFYPIRNDGKCAVMSLLKVLSLGCKKEFDEKQLIRELKLSDKEFLSLESDLIQQIKESNLLDLKEAVFERDDSGNLVTFFDIINLSPGSLSPDIQKEWTIVRLHNHFFVIQKIQEPWEIV